MVVSIFKNSFFLIYKVLLLIYILIDNLYMNQSRNIKFYVLVAALR